MHFLDILKQSFDAENKYNLLSTYGCLTFLACNLVTIM